MQDLLTRGFVLIRESSHRFGDHSQGEIKKVSIPTRVHLTELLILFTYVSDNCHGRRRCSFRAARFLLVQKQLSRRRAKRPDLAAGASKWSNLLTNVATTEACSFGAFCTNARMTTTASPATVSDGCKDNSNSDRMQIEAICGIIVTRSPPTAESSKRQTLAKMSANRLVTLSTNLAHFQR